MGGLRSPSQREGAGGEVARKTDKPGYNQRRDATGRQFLLSPGAASAELMTPGDWGRPGEPDIFVGFRVEILAQRAKIRPGP